MSRFPSQGETPTLSHVGGGAGQGPFHTPERVIDGLLESVEHADKSVFDMEELGPSPGQITADQIIDDMNSDMQLADAVAAAPIPFERFSDPYWEDHPDMYAFETMLRSSICAELHGIRYDNDLADFLDAHPDIAFKLGFEPERPDSKHLGINAFQTPETPHQTTITRTANKRFKTRVEEFISTVATEVEEYCRQHTHMVELTGYTGRAVLGDDFTRWGGHLRVGSRDLGRRERELGRYGCCPWDVQAERRRSHR